MHVSTLTELEFVVDKHGQLGIWDARAPPEETADEDGDTSTPEDGEGGKYWRLQVHWPATAKSSISCIKIDPVNAHNVSPFSIKFYIRYRNSIQLYTSSYDCSVRCLSFTTGTSHEVFSTDDTLICSIDLDALGREMWISDGEGGVSHLDVRQHKSKAKRYFLSESKIGCASVNPTRRNFLLTASNSRSLM